jgi:chromosome partitioning protein
MAKILVFAYKEWSMRKIAIINQKGGSGKTTTTVNLASALAEEGRRVLVIDLDPQGSTSHWFGCTDADKGLMKVFLDNAPLRSIITATTLEGVQVIPSSSWLIGLEKALANEVGAETLLKHRLQAVPQEMYDYILIDCPPTLGILTINALTACTEVLVPVEARIMAVNGLVQLLQTIEIVKSRLNSGLRLAGILLCRVDLRTRHSKEVVDELKSKFKKVVYITVIRENIRLSEAPSFAKTIHQYDPESNGAKDYKALAHEVIEQEQFFISQPIGTEVQPTV